MSVVDRRSQGKKKSTVNRKKFLDRYKGHIKRKVEKEVQDRSIKDFFDGREITVDIDNMDEPEFVYDSSSGRRDHVVTGNDSFKKGDFIPKPDEAEGGAGGVEGSKDGEGFDEFTFTLTKDEFFDLYFSEMELPDFVKAGIKSSEDYKIKRCGYCKEGIPPRLNVKKTFENAIARKIAQKAQGNEKPPFLDEVDLRYNNFTLIKEPIRHAVMFCLMDVSWSMQEFEKTLAKKFFLLLHLFLHSVYDEVDIRFIRHTQDAEEVSEHDFFYSESTGGTMVSSALELADRIITKEYDLESTNIYIVQASDGDNFSFDDGDVLRIWSERLIHKVQYVAYVQTSHPFQGAFSGPFGGRVTNLWALYRPLAEQYEKFNMVVLKEISEVFDVLKGLFKSE